MRTAINARDVQRTLESQSSLQNRVTIRRHSARTMSAGTRRGSQKGEWLHGTRKRCAAHAASSWSRPLVFTPRERAWHAALKDDHSKRTSIERSQLGLVSDESHASFHAASVASYGTQSLRAASRSARMVHARELAAQKQLNPPRRRQRAAPATQLLRGAGVMKC